MERAAISLGLLLHILSLGFGNPGRWDEDLEIDVLVAEMNETELAGQVLMLGYEGGYPTEEFIEFVRDSSVGGVKVFGWNSGNLRDLASGIKAMQVAAAASRLGVPLLVATDQEGGWVRHVKGATTDTPGNLAIGASGLAIDAFASGNLIGHELSSLGIYMNFAPTVDVYIHPDADVIGPRAFSSDPALTAFLAIAYFRGLEKSGVVATAKHFPGHGNTGSDSHGTKPVILDSYEVIHERDLVPYRALITEGLPAIMSGHLSFPNITGNDLPATLSSRFLKEILRDELGFDGVVITDDLRMYGALQNGMDILEVSHAAIEAGNDMIMISRDIDLHKAIHQSLVESALQDPAFRQTLVDAVTRIMRIKRDYLNDLPSSFGPDDLPFKEGQEAIFDLTSRSVAIYRGDSVPFDSGHIANGGAGILMVGQNRLFITEAERRFPDADLLPLPFGRASEETILKLKSMAEAAVRIVFCLENRQGIDILSEISEFEDKITVLSVLTPVYLRDTPWVRSAIATFSRSADSFRAGFAVLAGDFPAEGRMPIDIDSF